MRSLNPFWYGLVHGIIGLIVIGVPLLLTTFPKAGDMTISAVALLIVNYLEAHYSK